MAMNAWGMEAPFFTPPPVRGRYTSGLWKSSDSPTPPDPYKTADAQAKANEVAARTSTQLNRYDQITPFGTSTWKEVGASSNFDQAGYDQAMQSWRDAQAVKASTPVLPAGTLPWGFTDAGGSAPAGAPQGDIPMPERQAFTSTTNTNKWQNDFQLNPKIQSMLDQYLSKSQTPVADFSFNGDANRSRVEDALYQRQASRLNPRFTNEETALRSRLANQGITEGSEAYNKELELFGRTKNDAYENAARSAIGDGGNELTRAFNIDLATRNTQVSDRAAALNLLTGLATGAQVQAPGAGAGQVAAAPVAQSIYNSYQAQLANSNAENASNNQTMGTIGSLAASALMFF